MLPGPSSVGSVLSTESHSVLTELHSTPSRPGSPSLLAGPAWGFPFQCSVVEQLELFWGNYTGPECTSIYGNHKTLGLTGNSHVHMNAHSWYTITM